MYMWKDQADNYILNILGKNGEPQGSVDLDVAIKHRFRQIWIENRLTSDANG